MGVSLQRFAPCSEERFGRLPERLGQSLGDEVTRHVLEGLTAAFGFPYDIVDERCGQPHTLDDPTVRVSSGDTLGWNSQRPTDEGSKCSLARRESSCPHKPGMAGTRHEGGSAGYLRNEHAQVGAGLLSVFSRHRQSHSSVVQGPLPTH